MLLLFAFTGRLITAEGITGNEISLLKISLGNKVYIRTTPVADFLILPDLGIKVCIPPFSIRASCVFPAYSPVLNLKRDGGFCCAFSFDGNNRVIEGRIRRFPEFNDFSLIGGLRKDWILMEGGFSTQEGLLLGAGIELRKGGLFLKLGFFYPGIKGYLPVIPILNVGWKGY